MNKTSFIFMLSVILLATMIVVPTIDASTHALDYKVVWYRPLQASFWSQLADDTGSGTTPRMASVRTLDQNFQKIKLNLKANTVALAVPDDGSWQSQYGGGFSYDPHRRPSPQKAVAMEIVLAIANKHGLKVIFAINFSEYRRFIDDTYGDASGLGAFEYIQSILDPGVFYGAPWTTRLGLAGLTDRPIRAYRNDPRVAGWLFAGEWNTQIQEEKDFIVKYWNHFYNVVHWGGDYTYFTGIYSHSSPDFGDRANQIERIKEMKQLFKFGTGLSMPVKYV
jgi:hypothetical protein